MNSEPYEQARNPDLIGRLTLFIGEHPLPAGFKGEPLTHVQAYAVRYDRDVRLMPRTSSAIGAQVSMYGVGVPLNQSTVLTLWNCRCSSGSVLPRILDEVGRPRDQFCHQ
jgi:hypothetical protein